LRAIVVSTPGGPESLEFKDIPTPELGDDDVLVRIEAVGVNYIDVYHRTGLYPIRPPFVPGSEASGIVESVGARVTTLRPGDRVAYAMVLGSYAEFAVVPAAKLVPVPEAIDLRTAAAAMLQGMTAHYLTHSTYRVVRGNTVLIHAAAGGAGNALVQTAKHLAATVIGTASTKKLDLVRQAGADVVIDYTKENFEEAVMRATENRGVDVVYDSVGRDTFDSSLNCLALRGMLVLFGQASGVVPPVDPARLAKRGLYLTRPSLAHYTVTRDELLERATSVFDQLTSGALKLRIDRELPLADAAKAHRLLESRQTAGKILLLPHD